MLSITSTIVSPLYKKIMSIFPQNIAFCFAYGSAVKTQLENKKKDRMIDFIFAVKDPITWHQHNIHMNPSHYSALKYFGYDFVSRYQRNLGAKVYFNTLVPVDEYTIKYGIIAIDDLVTDLLEWSYLYLAGRLHKPVEIMKKPLDTELETALQLNLQSAIHAALLVLPESFTEYDLYYAISNLSYLGDFRMIFGEKKNKVQNIVKAQLPGFRNLYKPLLLNLQDYVDLPGIKENSTKDQVEENNFFKEGSQDICPLAKLHHLNQLPRLPQKALTRFWNKGSFRQDTEDVLRAIAYDPDCGTMVSQRINEIVWSSSVRQSLKGILTAGVLKSSRYSARKIKSMLS